jgi:hypothetical protein
MIRLDTFAYWQGDRTPCSGTDHTEATEANVRFGCAQAKVALRDSWSRSKRFRIPPALRAAILSLSPGDGVILDQIEFATPPNGLTSVLTRSGQRWKNFRGLLTWRTTPYILWRTYVRTYLALVGTSGDEGTEPPMASYREPAAY